MTYAGLTTADKGTLLDVKARGAEWVIAQWGGKAFGYKEKPKREEITDECCYGSYFEWSAQDGDYEIELGSMPYPLVSYQNTEPVNIDLALAQIAEMELLERANKAFKSNSEMVERYEQIIGEQKSDDGCIKEPMERSGPTTGEGEYGVKFNELTTDEIVRALRELAYKAEREGVVSLPCTIDLMLAWATDLEKTSSALSDCTDRLESKQRENADLNATLDDVYQDLFISHGAMRDEIERLKAERDAEKARADAAVNIAVRNVFYDMIGNCKSLMCYTSPCSYCQHDKSREKCAACFENGNFELRDDLRGEKGKATE